MAFAKYPEICSLEARHGVNVGSTYRNVNFCKDFIHFLSMSRKELASLLSKDNFFSLLMDGSTDAANVDNEVFVVVWCDTDAEMDRVCTKTSFVTVHQPPRATAVGFMHSLEHCLQCLGVEGLDSMLCCRLVGIGTDGASANSAAAFLKGLVEEKVPRVFWMWCLAHRLELAVKDGLSTTFFSSIDSMLIRLHYLYKKSPQKCAELKTIVKDFREARIGV